MNYLEKIINLIYPNVCGFCDKIYKNNICKKCELSIEKKILANINYYTNDKYFNKHLYIFKYEGIIREKLIDYKFNDKSYMYKAFGEIMLKNKKIFGFLKNYDIIIPVPIHKKRKKDRGYNQTELISKYVSNHINTLENLNDLLIKNTNTVPQSILNGEERKNSVKEIYETKDIDRIKSKKVLLMDDIYTTGSTVNECARMLRMGNPKILDVITIAKD